MCVHKMECLDNRRTYNIGCTVSDTLKSQFNPCEVLKLLLYQVVSLTQLVKTEVLKLFLLTTSQAG